MGTVLCLLAACSGGGGGGSSEAADSGLTLSLTASPERVDAGGSTTLEWSSSGANSCTASGAWSGDRSTSGSERIANISSTSTFSLSCSGSSGSTLREVTVRVSGNDFDVSLQLSEPVIMLGDAVEVNWSAPDADQCEAAGGWSGVRANSGSYVTPPLESNATFRLTCTAGSLSGSAMVSVRVTDPEIRWQAPTQNVDGTELTDLDGFNLYWGDSSRNYSTSVSLPATARDWLAELPPGRYYFAVTALNSLGEESDYSNEISKLIPY